VSDAEQEQVAMYVGAWIIALVGLLVYLAV
jgi:hypothetical protein